MANWDGWMVSYLDGLMYGWKVNWVDGWLVIWMD